MSSVPVSTILILQPYVFFLSLVHSWVVFEHQYSSCFFFSLVREEPFIIIDTNIIAWLVLNKLFLLNMWQFSIVVIKSVFWYWFLSWEGWTHLRGEVFCHSEIVYIMIRSSERDCGFQLLIFSTDILYKSPNLILIIFSFSVLLHSVKSSFQLCGNFVKVKHHLVLV